jgi:hypothetical protein
MAIGKPSRAFDFILPLKVECLKEGEKMTHLTLKRMFYKHLLYWKVVLISS